MYSSLKSGAVEAYLPICNLGDIALVDVITVSIPGKRDFRRATFLYK